jgi:hypothetical protein
MNPQQQDAVWRNRFIIINLVRIGATLLVLLGLAIWYSDIVRDGGAPEIGLPLALIALVVSFAGPQWLARRWRTPPE